MRVGTRPVSLQDCIDIVTTSDSHGTRATPYTPASRIPARNLARIIVNRAKCVIVFAYENQSSVLSSSPVSVVCAARSPDHGPNHAAAEAAAHASQGGGRTHGGLFQL